MGYNVCLIATDLGDKFERITKIATKLKQSTLKTYNSETRNLGAGERNKTLWKTL